MNEKAIGRALEDIIGGGQVARCDFYITTKIWCNNHTEERALEAVRRSLANLRLEYLDLVLIHWPFSFHSGDDQLPFTETTDNCILEAEPSEANFTLAYRGLEAAVHLGLVRSLGVSNFTVTQLDRLLEVARIKPTVLQVECHPFLIQAQLLDYCRGKSLQLQAHNPFRRGDSALLECATLKAISSVHCRSVGQIILRWLLQRSVCVVAKSVSSSRMADNLDVFGFCLSNEEMRAISSLNRNKRLVFFPSTAHLREYPF